MSIQHETLWDPLIRLFHWSIAGVFVANYFINEAGEAWHEWLGYGAIAWLLVRFIWGFCGPRAARWSDFFPTPARLFSHVNALITGHGYHRAGHSPLGGLIMILMMLCILLLGITGFMMEEIDYFWGEDWVIDLHAKTADVLLTLVCIHVFAALFESYRLKENLPLSMITGKRRVIKK
jgi:cytochrome b